MKTKLSQEFIGKRGEMYFESEISSFLSPNGELFRPIFLGDKYPTVDYFIDLRNYTKKKGFFFASVKATTRGTNKDLNKLKISSISKKEVKELNKFPVPVYLFGINLIIDKNEIINYEGYFISCNKLNSSKNLNGIPTKYQLNARNIEKLWKEIQDYWENNNEITNFVSSFKP